MAKWAHRPPSERRVKIVLSIIALCLLLGGIEYFIGWPDWLTTNGGARGARP
ncbi:hypothetical protein [Maritimibacter sp. 55A14]|uniref:hypothetical protein n=1 Tax=Maritimibacter sp. 55A14 TaxID=2174844 RepID=UPI00268492AE